MSIPDIGGRIGSKWAELGGPDSFLGNPVEGEVRTPTGAWRRFERGHLLWSPRTDAHVSLGEIRKAHGRHGFEHGHLGYPTTDEFRVEGGIGQHYERGSIYWSVKGGAQAVHGAIRDRWAAHGWERGPLGFPTSEEQPTVNNGRFQRFVGGIVYWSPKTGAWPVWGMMLDAYGRQGWERGQWGYPTGGEVRKDGEFFQGFQGGVQKVGTPAVQRVAVPRLSEADPKQWVRLPGGTEGWCCPCMAVTLPLIEADMKRRGLIRSSLDVFQFAYNQGGVAASAGTHDAGGVIDVGQYSRACREVWASWGVMMFPRTAQYGWRGGEHGHGVWHGCVHRTASAAQQVRSGLAGRDGLVSNTFRDFIKPSRTWQDAVRAHQ